MGADDVRATRFHGLGKDTAHQLSGDAALSKVADDGLVRELANALALTPQRVDLTLEDRSFAIHDMDPRLNNTLDHLDALGQLILQGTLEIHILNKRAHTDFLVIKDLET